MNAIWLFPYKHTGDNVTLAYLIDVPEYDGLVGVGVVGDVGGHLQPLHLIPGHTAHAMSHVSLCSPGLGPGPPPAPLATAVVHGVEQALAVAGPVPRHPGPSEGRVQVEVIGLGPHRHHGQPRGAGHGVAGRHAHPGQARALKQINKMAKQSLRVF